MAKIISADQLACWRSGIPYGKELLWKDVIDRNRRKIIVLDDDPTGTQTVHDITVFTGWDRDTIRACFEEKEPLVFILTNSRSLTEEQTIRLHREIADSVAAVSKETGQDFILVSRSDSTLRGHYPIETWTLKESVEKNLGISYDGEIICPFFLEGGRYTLHNIHYVKEGGFLIPAGETEFARDENFSYKSSDLRDWCVEKAKGAFTKEEIHNIPNEWLSQGDEERTEQLLREVRGFQKVIVNAVSGRDLQCFSAALLHVLDEGRHFMIRCAASLPKALGGITDRPLLTRQELVDKENGNGGIVVVGSHVNKTTEQVACLMGSRIPIEQVEFNQHLVMDPKQMAEEVDRVVLLAETAIRGGKHVLVYTKREKLEPEGLNMGERAGLAANISDAVSNVIGCLGVRPSFIVAKGGITSSDICTKGLGVTKARVMGQAAPGVPVWKTGEGSKFPGMPYVIFPGNVGDKDTLKKVVEMLAGE